MTCVVGCEICACGASWPPAATGLTHWLDKSTVAEAPAPAAVIIFNNLRRLMSAEFEAGSVGGSVSGGMNMTPC
jgi:hypothetical protein